MRNAFSIVGCSLAAVIIAGAAFATTARAQDARGAKTPEQRKATCLAKPLHKFLEAGQTNPATGEPYKRTQCRLNIPAVKAAIAEGKLTQ